jgi:hypothetical protein
MNPAAIPTAVLPTPAVDGHEMLTRHADPGVPDVERPGTVWIGCTCRPGDWRSLARHAGPGVNLMAAAWENFEHAETVRVAR